MSSIDWKKRIILIDFQKAESQAPVQNINLKNKIVKALKVDFTNINLELEFIYKLLSDKQTVLIKATLEGYTLKEIQKHFYDSYNIIISQATLSRERNKIYKFIAKLYQ